MRRPAQSTTSRAPISCPSTRTPLTCGTAPSLTTRPETFAERIDREGGLAVGEAGQTGLEHRTAYGEGVEVLVPGLPAVGHRRRLQVQQVDRPGVGVEEPREEIRQLGLHRPVPARQHQVRVVELVDAGTLPPVATALLRAAGTAALSRSSSTTRCPERASRRAVASPVSPEPMTTTGRSAVRVTDPVAFESWAAPCTRPLSTYQVIWCSFRSAGSWCVAGSLRPVSTAHSTSVRRA